MPTLTKPPVSSARSAAARKNGANGKGPKTVEGKAKSSQNALKHGLSAGRWLSLPDDEEGAYEEFFQWVYEDLAPEGAEQIVYATRMIECMWRLRRITTLEAKLVETEPIRQCPTGLDLKGGWLNHINDISRYEASLERTLERNRRALKKLQNEPKPFGSPLPLDERGLGEGPRQQPEIPPSNTMQGGSGQSVPPPQTLEPGSPEPETEPEPEPASLHERRTLELAEVYRWDHPDATLEEAIRAVNPHLPDR